MLTEPLLIKVAPASAKVAVTVVDWFNKYAYKYEITTPKRVAAFIAQLCHESNSFKATREYASGSAYEGRTSLGNIYKGDGVKFKGRGYIQITGRSNYTEVSKSLFGDLSLLSNPDLLATPQYAMLSAMWYWNSRSLNAAADKQYFKTITLRINGGLNGFADRVQFYNRLCREFGLPEYDIVTMDIKK